MKYSSGWKIAREEKAPSKAEQVAFARRWNAWNILQIPQGNKFWKEVGPCLTILEIGCKLHVRRDLETRNIQPSLMSKLQQSWSAVREEKEGKREREKEGETRIKAYSYVAFLLPFVWFFFYIFLLLHSLVRTLLRGNLHPFCNFLVLCVYLYSSLSHFYFDFNF